MRGIALLIVLAVALTGSPAAAATGIGAQLVALLESDATSFEGQSSIVVIDPSSGFRYEHLARAIVPAASLYKLGVMIEAYRQVDAGILSLQDTTITLGNNEDDLLAPSDRRLALPDAIERMLDWSDNGSALALLDVLDPHKVNAMYAMYGLVDTRINTALPEGERTADFNTTTATDTARLFSLLLQGRVVSPAASADMLEVLKRQHLDTRLPRGVPTGTAIAHKTGDLDRVAHDAGIVWTPFGPRVVALLTTGANVDDVSALAERVSRHAYWTMVDRFSTSLELAGTRTAPDGSLIATVRATNTSTYVWDGTQRLAGRWVGADGGYLTGGRRSALAELRPGETAIVEVTLDPPRAGAAYFIELDVVDRNEMWTRDRLMVPVQPVR